MEKLEAPHPINGLLRIFEIAVFQILILLKENISLNLFVSGIKPCKIELLLKKPKELNGISRIKIVEIKTKIIEDNKKSVLILIPINNVKAIKKLVIAFLE